MSANDKQIQGDHYRKHGDHQPWDVLRSWLTPEEYRGWMKGNAIVYLARERDKGGDQDIAKAAHHLEKLGEVLAANSHQPAPDSHQQQATIAPTPQIAEPVAPREPLGMKLWRDGKHCSSCKHGRRINTYPAGWWCTEQTPCGMDMLGMLSYNRWQPNTVIQIKDESPLPPICQAATPSCATCRHADRAECPPGCVRLSKWEAA